MLRKIHPANRWPPKRLATTSSMTVTLELAQWARLTEIATQYKQSSLSKAITICVKKFPKV